VFEAIRNRFDGKKRNPFNEGEYGHRYARAMAAWGGVIAWTGFEYSGVSKTIKFKSDNGNWFWSNGYAYGTVTIKDSAVSLKVIGGQLELSEFDLGNHKHKFKKVQTIGEGEMINFSCKN